MIKEGKKIIIFYSIIGLIIFILYSFGLYQSGFNKGYTANEIESAKAECINMTFEQDLNKSINFKMGYNDFMFMEIDVEGNIGKMKFTDYDFLEKEISFYVDIGNNITITQVKDFDCIENLNNSNRTCSISYVGKVYEVVRW